MNFSWNRKWSLPDKCEPLLMRRKEAKIVYRKGIESLKIFRDE
jgi:hypothetical protein